MKALLSVVFCSLLVACSKGDTSTPTPITLNAKEKILVGHWQLKQVTDSAIYTSIGIPTIKSETKYSSTDFIELNSKKEWAKNLDPRIKDARIGGAGAALNGANASTTGTILDFIGWYYDEGVNKLVLNNIFYDVILVSGSELVLWRSTISGSYYISNTATYSK